MEKLSQWFLHASALKQIETVLFDAEKQKSFVAITCSELYYHFLNLTY